MADEHPMNQDPALLLLRSGLNVLTSRLADDVMERVTLTAQVGERKAEMGWPIVANGREEAIKKEFLVALQERGYDGDPQFARDFMDVLIRYSVLQQEGIKRAHHLKAHPYLPPSHLFLPSV